MLCGFTILVISTSSESVSSLFIFNDFPPKSCLKPDYVVWIQPAPRSLEILWEAILNLSGQIDLPVTLESSHYSFINIWLFLNLIFRTWII